MPKVYSLIAAGGSGRRFGSGVPKQFVSFGGRVPIESVVYAFRSCCFVDRIVCIVPWPYTGGLGFLHPDDVVVGGDTRQMSVLKGLEYISRDDPDFVLVHDAARPFLSDSLICRVIKKLFDGAKAVVPVVELPDSLRFRRSESSSSVNRENFVSVQTPQGFAFKELWSLHKKYKNESFHDDASMFDREGMEVTLIDGDVINKKISYSCDVPVDHSVGFGVDVHAFSSDPSRNLKIFGVEIPHDFGLDGVSDADVGVHSLVDAILGALGLGDIGDHFPPADSRFKDCPSSVFLDFCKKKLEECGRAVANVDSVVVCEEPKISTFKNQMKEFVAKVLGINKNLVNIKGKTTEKLGFCGRGEGVCVLSTVCLRSML
jgi:2-C-methyl-D-erythritol 4-phosphate cytidylyltransferase/2-C-methyl-D-erythritol 2,4-cyclodiphosphate synthase